MLITARSARLLARIRCFSLLLALAMQALQASAQEAWVEDSFADFADGSFQDAGSNLYVSRQGRIQIINRWDLNSDGHLDIVVPSGHGHTEKEDAFLYFNNGAGDIEGKSLVKIPTNGAVDGEIADWNGDGFNDLAITHSENGVTVETDTYIYYGGRGGFTSERRTLLPSIDSSRVLTGDYNGDGSLDLFIQCKWQTDYLKDEGVPVSLLYWNGPGGFDPHRRMDVSIPEKSITCSASHDMNGDGLADLILGAGNAVFLLEGGKEWDNATPRQILSCPQSCAFIEAGLVDTNDSPDLVVSTGSDVRVYFGREGGFREEPDRVFPVSNGRGVCIADLNLDGTHDIAVARDSGDDGAPWVNSSVYYSAQGRFEEADRVSLPTMGARFVSASDLNGDRRPDLVFCNSQVTNQHNIPSMVYWNDESGFDPNRVTLLETAGAFSNDCGDLDNDGHPDVAFYNHEGGFRDGPSDTRIYWGDGTRDYGANNMLSIPSYYISSAAHADLDDDGFVDLMLAQERFISGAGENIFTPLMIYWGSTRGFDRKTNLTVDSMGGGIRVIDIDRDGFLDLSVGGTSSDRDDPSLEGTALFLGSASGYSNLRREIVASHGGDPYRVPLFADFNQDGHLDAAMQGKGGEVRVFSGTGFREDRFGGPVQSLILDDASFFGYLNCADFDRDGWLDLFLPVRRRDRSTEVVSYVVYGGPNGFALGTKTELESYATTDDSIADLNRDGYLDLFMHSYKSNRFRNMPAFVYWGGQAGFSNDRRQELPGWGSAGVETADYDGDGWIDVFMTNHCRDGSTTEPGPQNHRTESFLFWNGPEGLSGDRRRELPAVGPHAMSVRDVGNHYDRGLYEDYISSPFELPDGKRPRRLSWSAETPHGTSVRFQIREAKAEEGLEAAGWRGPDGIGTWFAQATDLALSDTESGWVQYRARLASPEGGNSPLLTRVELSMTP